MDLSHWFNDPSRIGATVLLLSACYAFYKGLIVPRWSYDALVASHKAQIEVMNAVAQQQLTRALDDCKVHKEMNIRLLEQWERTVSVTEVTTDAAIRAARKP